MLNWCFECVGGKQIGETAPTEVIYESTNINSSFRAPHWPTPKNKDEIMFIVPRTLKSGDHINVSGIMKSDPKLLVAGLVTGDSTPDYANVACQVEAAFPEKFTVKYTKNGEDNVVVGSHTESNVSERIKDNFKFEFIFQENFLVVKVNEMDLEYVTLKHNLEEIKFISIRGDYRKVGTLEFSFQN